MLWKTWRGGMLQRRGCPARLPNGNCPTSAWKATRILIKGRAVKPRTSADQERTRDRGALKRAELIRAVP